jgi:predicted amidophosphoribosyltransferase
MDEGCGCIVVLVVLAVLGWLSTIIGDAWSIEPIWVFVGLIILVIGLLCLFSFLLTQADKKRQKRFEEIRNTYPKAYSKYAAEKRYTDDSKIPLNFKKEVTKRSEYSWKNEEQTLVKEEQDRIKKEQDEKQAEENRQMKEIESLYPNGLRIWKGRYPMLSSNQRYMVRSREAISILEDEFVAKEEQRKIEEKRIANQKREEQKIRLQSTAKDVLVRKAKSWDKLFLNFHYTWLFYYYPTTCDFEPPYQDWENRRTVWNFKNDPERNIMPAIHERAIDLVIPQIKQKLTDTFGEEYVQFLTLVCLPASTNVKHRARYEVFSSQLCAETGMENGYPYTFITKDGLSKNDPNNNSGRSIQPEVRFDDWFRGKCVLLFDDIVTKGGTMLRYKDMLERKGATVIGGIALGKTKHEMPTHSSNIPPDFIIEPAF